MANDGFDHVTLYKLLATESGIGTYELFEMTTKAVQTIVQPSRSSMQEISSSKGEALSISLNYGSLLASRGGTSI